MSTFFGILSPKFVAPKYLFVAWHKGDLVDEAEVRKPGGKDCRNAIIQALIYSTSVTVLLLFKKIGLYL